MEAGIHSLPLHLGEGDGRFQWNFFHQSPNMLGSLSPQDAPLSDYIKVIDIAQIAVNLRLNVLMDGAEEKAVGYLERGNWALVDSGEGTLSTF